MRLALSPKMAIAVWWWRVFNTAGALDTSFGDDGIATVNVQEAGTAETVRGIVLQADGKIILAGTAEGIEREEEIPAATNINIVVVRLNADGTVDPSFGEDGVQQLDLSVDVDNVGDTVWGVDRDAQDRVLVFGATKGDCPAGGPRPGGGAPDRERRGGYVLCHGGGVYPQHR